MKNRLSELPYNMIDEVEIIRQHLKDLKQNIVNHLDLIPFRDASDNIRKQQKLYKKEHKKNA